jgi:hypothetical protein
MALVTGSDQIRHAAPRYLARFRDTVDFEIRDSEPLGPVPSLDRRVLLHIYVLCTSSIHCIQTGESHAGTPGAVSMSLCALWAVHSSKSVKRKPVLGWWWLWWWWCCCCCCCCCVHMHTPWAACNRSPSLPLRNLHSTPHPYPHPHAHLPVASSQLLCSALLSSPLLPGIKAALDPALSPFRIPLPHPPRPSANHWVLVLLKSPCATPVP